MEKIHEYIGKDYLDMKEFTTVRQCDGVYLNIELYVFILSHRASNSLYAHYIFAR